MHCKCIECNFYTFYGCSTFHCNHCLHLITAPNTVYSNMYIRLMGVFCDRLPDWPKQRQISQNILLVSMNGTVIIVDVSKYSYDKL